MNERFRREDLEEYVTFDPMRDTKECITEKPGNYAILLRPGCSLPGQYDEDTENALRNNGLSDYADGPYSKVPYIACPVTYKGVVYELVYVGRSELSLRNREYDKYFTANNSGQSTFRKSVGSLMGMKQVYRSKGEVGKRSPKTKFAAEDEAELTEWSKRNLLFLFKPCDNAKEMKMAMVKELDPVLNLEEYPEHSLNIPYRKMLKRIRKPDLLTLTSE